MPPAHQDRRDPAAGHVDGADIAGSVFKTSLHRLPLPASLGDVSVSVNGINAPIHVIANRNGQEQVNFQVPFEATGTTATVVVTRAGAASSPVQVQLFAAQPAVYTLDGSEAVAVHNADYTLVTAERPLDRNEYAFIYASGLGRVSNSPATGAIRGCCWRWDCAGSACIRRACWK